MRQSKEGKTQEKVNKIFTRGATAILKALNNQLEYILDTDIDKRLNCVYISNIDYDRNESIDDSIILDIEETTNKLNYCNAMTFVRETTLSVIGSAQRSLTRVLSTSLAFFILMFVVFFSFFLRLMVLIKNA